MEAAEIFAKMARRRLEELKMTHEGLAKRLGVNRVQVSRALVGENAPRIDTLLRWADALGVTVEYLLGREVVTNEAHIAEIQSLQLEAVRLALACSDLAALRQAICALGGRALNEPEDAGQGAG